MNINEIKTELKTQYPTLRKGSEEGGYIELSAEEYETTITDWAQDIYVKQEEAAQAEAKAAQKAALLDRIGITEEEAKLLLA